jgi:hypothetical protein
MYSVHFTGAAQAVIEQTRTAAAQAAYRTGTRSEAAQAAVEQIRSETAQPAF